MDLIVVYRDNKFSIREWKKGDTDYPFAADFDDPDSFLMKVSRNENAVCDLDFIARVVAMAITDLERKVKALENRLNRLDPTRRKNYHETGPR
jgi:hypothetical protein